MAVPMSDGPSPALMPLQPPPEGPLKTGDWLGLFQLVSPQFPTDMLFVDKIAPFLDEFEIWRLRVLCKVMRALTSRCKVTEADFGTALSTRSFFPRTMVDFFGAFQSTLVSVRIPYFGSRQWIAELSVCKNIKTLDLSYSGNIPDAEMSLIADSFPALEELTLHGFVALTSAGLKNLLKLAPSLRRLNLAYCRSILPLAGTLSQFTRLQVLCVSRIWLTDEDLADIAPCKQLHTLLFEAISKDPAHSDKGLADLVAQLPCLATLSLARNAAVGDLTVNALRDHRCETLEYLNLDTVLRPSVEAVSGMITACRKLRFLNIAQCEQLQASFETLQALRPDMELWRFHMS